MGPTENFTKLFCMLANSILHISTIHAILRLFCPYNFFSLTALEILFFWGFLNQSNLIKVLNFFFEKNYGGKKIKIE